MNSKSLQQSFVEWRSPWHSCRGSTPVLHTGQLVASPGSAMHSAENMSAGMDVGVAQLSKECTLKAVLLCRLDLASDSLEGLVLFSEFVASNLAATDGLHYFPQPF